MADEYFVWKGLSDFRQTMYKRKLLQTEEYNQMHDFCLGYIKKGLAESTAKHIVVVTYHLPIFQVVAPGHKGSVLNSAFATEYERLMVDNQVDAWVYGHSHTNIDTEIVGQR